MPKNEVSLLIRAQNTVAQGLKEAKGEVSTFAGEVKGLLLGAFVGGSVVEFFKRAVEGSQEAIRANNQLANTLANIGVDAARARPELDATIDALRKVAVVDDDEAVGAFNTLVQVTGNYKASLHNMQLVADLAAAKQISLAEAAEQVGKVMSGTGQRALRDFGITTTDTGEALEQLRQKVAGAAHAELDTFEGAVTQTGIAVDDLTKAFGNTITKSPAVQRQIAALVDWFRQATEWVDKHRVEIGFWGSVVLDVAKAAAITIGNVVAIAFNAGKVLGGALQAIFWDTVHGVADAINTIPVTLNRMLDAANKIPGVHIDFRFPDLTAFVEDAAQATEAANDTVRDAGRTIGTSLGAIGRSWLAVGDAAEASAGQEIEGLQRTRAELERNRRAHEQLEAQKRQAAADEAAKKAQAAEDARNKTIDDTIAKLAQAGQFERFRTQAIAGLTLAEHAATAALQAHNLSLAEQLVLETRLAKIQEAKKKLGVVQEKSETERIVDQKTTETLTSLGKVEAPSAQDLEKQLAELHLGDMVARELRPADILGGGALGQIQAALAQARQEIQGAQEQTLSFGDAIRGIAEGPITGFGEASSAALDAWVTGSGRAGAAFESTIKKTIANTAATEGKYFAGKALGALGEGLFSGNPQAFAAAAEYAAAATALFAVAKFAGGGGSGGGGGSAGGAGNGSGSANDRAGVAGSGSGGALTVVIPSRKFGWDPTNPDDLESLKEMFETLANGRDLNLTFSAG